MSRIRLLALLPTLLLFAEAANAGWPAVATGEESHMLHESTRMKNLDPFSFQSPFLPAFGDDMKLTTIVQRHPIDPRQLGMRKARGAAKMEYSCVSTQTAGARNLGKGKDKFDSFGNAATTIDVSANRGCDFFFAETRFKGGQRQPAGSSVNVINAVQRLPATADPGCFDLDTLCLQGGRFKVEIDWTDFEGNGRDAVPVARSDDSGLFYFFDADNWEMLIKVLDGCSVNDHFWVFSSSLTNVEYTVTVTDTQSNLVKSYENPLGGPSDAITDTSAFATCP